MGILDGIVEWIAEQIMYGLDTALELHGMTGTLICFDYQEEALREICGQRVILQSIDFQQFERSVLYS